MPRLTDFTERQKMAGEYPVMGIYPRGHLMDFVRPRLRRSVLPAAAVYDVDEGNEATVAGWPIARQHPRGPDGATNVIATDVRAVRSGVAMLSSHDRR